MRKGQVLRHACRGQAAVRASSEGTGGREQGVGKARSKDQAT